MFNKIRNIFNKNKQNLQEKITPRISSSIVSTQTTHVDNSIEIANIEESKNNNSSQTNFEKTIAKKKTQLHWVNEIGKKIDVDIKSNKVNPIQGVNNAEKFDNSLKYNGEALHFGCTLCGKCCNVPPKVEFDELLRLKDHFIFQTNHTCFLSYNRNPLPKEITDFYTGIGHNIVLTDLEAVMFYYIEFTPMLNPSYKQCSKLIDNKCSIYDIRPHSCELYPFSKNYEQEEQWRSIKFFEKKVQSGEYECDFSNKSPIIYDQHMFNDYSIETRFEQSIENIHNFTNYYIAFLEKMGGKEYKNNHFKYLVNAISQKSLFISDTLNPMLVGVINNLITKEQAEDFIKSQLALITYEIENSKKNKSKENLHTSRLYLKQKQIFEKALLTDMFDVSKYNNL